MSALKEVDPRVGPVTGAVIVKAEGLTKQVTTPDHARLFVCVSWRLVASDVNATRRQCPLIEMLNVDPFACWPALLTVTRVIWPV